MKLSVSVPEPLWDSARESRPDLNPSRLVQEALDSWVRTRSATPYPVGRPPEADARFDAARARLTATARAEFERGYVAAVKCAETLDWDHFQSLARGRFEVRTWAANIASAAVQADLGAIPREWAPAPATVSLLLEALGSIVAPFGDDMFTPSVPYVRGFAQAVRDLWTDAVEGRGGRPDE